MQLCVESSKSGVTTESIARQLSEGLMAESPPIGKNRRQRMPMSAHNIHFRPQRCNNQILHNFQKWSTPGSDMKEDAKIMINVI